MLTMMHRADEKRRLEKVIRDHLKQAPELRPFPEAVTRLISACRDTETASKDIEAIVACDPSLSVKLLRLANSPLFSAAREVHSIVHAIALLGRRRVKSIALSAAATDMMISGRDAQQQRQDLWNHSVGCAAVATLLAKDLANVDQEDAFLAGIFHDVGKLLFLDVIPNEYEELTSTYLGACMTDEESFLFGTTHEQIGVTAANLWGLSDEILSAIGWHHHPEDNPLGHPHAAVISLANEMAKKWGVGSRPIPEIDLDQEALDRWSIDADRLESLETDAGQLFAETINAWSR